MSRRDREALIRDIEALAREMVRCLVARDNAGSLAALQVMISRIMVAWADDGWRPPALEDGLERDER